MSESEYVNFYRYISKTDYSYRILKDNEDFGSYSKLTDALYERDRLIEANWSWDDVLQLPETENPYEDMDLPPFISEYEYIYEVAQNYSVFKDNEYKCNFNTKSKAYEYADEIGGVVYPMHKRYRVSKTINNTTHYFGQYATFEEAKQKRDELIRNGWKE